jgi:hypothetical protein
MGPNSSRQWSGDVRTHVYHPVSLRTQLIFEIMSHVYLQKLEQ